MGVSPDDAVQECKGPGIGWKMSAKRAETTVEMEPSVFWSASFVGRIRIASLLDVGLRVSSSYDTIAHYEHHLW